MMGDPQNSSVKQEITGTIRQMSSGNWRPGASGAALGGSI